MPRGFCGDNGWTLDEQALIVRHYHEDRARGLLKLLPTRSKQSIRQQACDLRKKGLLAPSRREDR